jgi:hypothetical protein
MIKSNAVFSFVAKCTFSFFAAFALMACEEEKKSEPLPDLPPIEIPEDVPGLYSGRLPCDDCTSRMVRMTLGEDNSVEAVQVVLRDTMTTDTLRGTYVVTDSTIKVSLSEDKQHWSFKRAKFGNLTYLTAAGTVYEDEDGMTADLIHIFKAKKPTPKATADSSKSETPDSVAVSKE